MADRATSVDYLNRKEYLRAFYQKRKTLYKESHLKKTYGLTLEDLFKLLEDQNYLCPICKIDLSKKNPKSIHIDHCHNSNKIRGVLCSNCNMALGLLKENKDTLKACLEYLEEHDGG